MKLNLSAFSEIKDRIKFVDYETLAKQYEYEVFICSSSATI